MLQKWICEECWEKVVKTDRWWSVHFDKGECLCPFSTTTYGTYLTVSRKFKKTNVEDIPPTWCPFTVEHAVET